VQVITIGIDPAKNVLQVHGVVGNNEVIFNKPYFPHFRRSLST
jgi:hypothetical protein